MRKARAEMELTNLKLIVPFCCTVDEVRKVLAAMARHGLQRGDKELEVYVMGAIPSTRRMEDTPCKRCERSLT